MTCSLQAVGTYVYKPFKDRRKDASVKVEEDWEIVREIEFNQLAPLRTSDLPEAEDLYECGSVETYDLGYDRITPKVTHKKPLLLLQSTFIGRSTDEKICS